MNPTLIAGVALVSSALGLAAPALAQPAVPPAVAPAAPPAGSALAIGQVSGVVFALRADGRPRIVSTGSRVAVGDTLASQADAYVRLPLGEGREALLGPATMLKVVRHSARETVLVLLGGLVQVEGGPASPDHRFTLQAGDATIDAAGARFTAGFQPEPAPAQARRQDYLRHSLAAVGPVAGDAGDDQPLREVIAQITFPSTGTTSPAGPPSPPARGPGAPLAPGLHVFVVDGLIRLSNAGGSLNFSAGQFGFVRSNATPPILLPNNPGLKFSPPPVFSSTNQNAASGNRPASPTVDCEVR